MKGSSVKHINWLAIVAATVASTTLVQAADDSETIRQLKEQVQALEQKVKVLERNRELDLEADEARQKQTPQVSAGANGFSMSSANSNYVLKIRGYVQTDARAYFNDHPGAKDTFLIRRARPIFEGTVAEHYDYRVMMDFASGLNATSNNVAFLQDAHMNVHYWPEFQIQLGKMKEPVGLERLQSGANLLFAERGYPTQLVPNRDVGIQFHGKLFEERVTYALGIFNGVSDGNSGDLETDDNEKDFAGRIFVEPFKTSERECVKGLGFGVAGTFGSQKGPLKSFVTPGQQKFFSYRTGAGTNSASANISADGDHWRIVPQAYYYWRGLGILGEYALSSQQLRRDAGKVHEFAQIENRAWQLAVSYLLTGENNSFKPIAPRKPFSISEGGWGAWEVAARIGQLSIDDAAFPGFAKSSSAREATSWAVGLNWYLNKNVKLNLDYEQTAFKGGSRKAGDVTAEDEQIFFGRAQFAF